MTDSEMRAALRIQKALAKIEAAQNLLGEACGELCPIVGAIKQWREVGKLYDQVKATWHSVNESTAGKTYRMDSY